MRYLAFILSADFQFVRIVVADIFKLCFHISDNLIINGVGKIEDYVVSLW